MLKPEVSVSVGLATAAMVYGIYSNMTPTIADIRSARPKDDTLDSSRKLASWTAATAVAGISLVAKDPTIFVLGGGMIIALDWSHRHANEVNPQTGKATIAKAMDAADAGYINDSPYVQTVDVAYAG